MQFGRTVNHAPGTVILRGKELDGIGNVQPHFKLRKKFKLHVFSVHTNSNSQFLPVQRAKSLGYNYVVTCMYWIVNGTNKFYGFSQFYIVGTLSSVHKNIFAWVLLLSQLQALPTIWTWSGMGISCFGSNINASMSGIINDFIVRAMANIV